MDIQNYPELATQSLSIPLIDLDSINWLPGWEMRSHEELREIVAEKTLKESWVISGNYFKLRQITWNNADAVIWLDYSFRICLWRCLKRAFKSICTKNNVCGENTETLLRLFSRNSVLFYLTKYRELKKRYMNLMQSIDYQHLSFTRLSSPKKTELWLKSYLY